MVEYSPKMNKYKFETSVAINSSSVCNIIFALCNVKYYFVNLIDWWYVYAKNRCQISHWIVHCCWVRFYAHFPPCCCIYHALITRNRVIDWCILAFKSHSLRFACTIECFCGNNPLICICVFDLSAIMYSSLYLMCFVHERYNFESTNDVVTVLFNCFLDKCLLRIFPCNWTRCVAGRPVLSWI